MREANAARILTVVLATAGLSACSSSVDTTGTGGNTTTGSTTTGSTTTTTTTTGSDSMIADALPPPLECSVVGDGHTFTATAQLNGASLLVKIDFDYSSGQYPMGWAKGPLLVASTELGTVGKVDIVGESITLTIDLVAGATGGTLEMSGDLSGFSQSGQTVTCPVKRTFKVDLSGASPQIALRDPAPATPLEQRPRLVLTLLGSDGLRAKVRATGVPEGAAVELDTTGGEARREGGLVDWALPPEPGLYQLEVVVRRGAAIATSALAVEVKET